MSPFDEGVVAATSGMSRDANPYEPGTDAHEDWDDGYGLATPDKYEADNDD